jgi:hypothetical protein
MENPEKTNEKALVKDLECAIALSDKILDKILEYDFDISISQAALGMSWIKSMILTDMTAEKFKAIIESVCEYFKIKKKEKEKMDKKFGEWIRCKEKFPPDGKCVLILTSEKEAEDEEWIISISHRDKGKWCFGKKLSERLKNPIFWTLLPAPPEIKD